MDLKAIPVRAVKITPENKCSFCVGSKCCNYVTQKIDGPRSKYDFEHLLWQLSHDNMQVYKDSEGWFLQMNTRCKHLQTDGRCGIYETRPQICRDHSNDYCEYDQPADEGHDLMFDSYESLLVYCKKRFKNWGKK
ncbi:MAG: YkgJ family cysteine cluster protein [Gammaproteobacteria bacterium]|nr:YkgJ family cysteine cluster protein [Gammaproteobacteria bacterium]